MAEEPRCVAGLWGVWRPVLYCNCRTGAAAAAGSGRAGAASTAQSVEGGGRHRSAAHAASDRVSDSDVAAGMARDIKNGVSSGVKLPPPVTSHQTQPSGSSHPTFQ